MIVIDASAVIAYFNAAERRHEAVADWLEGVDEELVTTPLVLAEIDYVLDRRAGAQATEALWADLEEGIYSVCWWSGALAETIDAARGARRRIGLADASLVALAAHVGTTTIATLDERHFRHLKPAVGGDAFILIPEPAGT
jgi:predicted nucleic acid-binding protein